MAYQVYQENQYKRWEVNESEFLRLCQDIASQLGKWQIQDSSIKSRDCCSLAFDKYEINLRVEYSPNATERKNPRIKIGISGGIAEAGGKSLWFILGSKQIEPYTTQISVAIARGAVTIAKEINKRLIPDYMVLYQEAYKVWKQREDADNAKKHLAKQLAAIIDGRPHPNHEGCSVYEYVDLGLQHSLHLEFRINSLDNHDLKLSSVPNALMTQILQLINSHSTQSCYEKWLGKIQKTVLYQLNKKLGLEDTDNELLELPSNNFDWRKMYHDNLSDWVICERFSQHLDEQSVLAA